MSRGGATRRRPARGVAAGSGALSGWSGPECLTEREAEVIALLARGRQTKQVAHRLGISAETADRHIQNTYSKIGGFVRAELPRYA